MENLNFNILKSKPELAVILWVIKNKDQASDNELETLTRNIDWEKLVELSIIHGVIPIVYKKIRSVKDLIIPEEILSRMKNIYFKIVQWSYFHSYKMLAVIRLFEKKGINVIPIKGPIVSIQAYGDIGFRMFQDIDLLVKPLDFSSAYDLLLENGYTPSIHLSKKKKKLWRRFRKDMEFCSSDSMIDLHQGFAQGNSKFDMTDERFQSGSLLEVLNKNVQVLSLEDTVIYLCINNTKDQWDSMRMVADLSYLIYLNKEIRWDLLIKKSKKMGVLRMVLAGLYHIFKITDEKIPLFLKDLIRNDKKVFQLSNLYFQRVVNFSSDRKTTKKLFALLSTMDSVYFKLKFLLHFIFSPTREDLRLVSFPDIFFWLYYIFRPLRLGILSIKNIYAKISGAE